MFDTSGGGFCRTLPRSGPLFGGGPPGQRFFDFEGLREFKAMGFLGGGGPSLTDDER